MEENQIDVKDIPKNVFQKLLMAKDEVGVIKKNGRVEFKSTKYNYQKAEDIDLAVRDAFQSVGLVVIPEDFVVVSDVGSVVTIVQKFRIVDVDTQESFVCAMGGQGQDSGDKRIYKAETGAFKYLFKQLLQITSQESDPDNFPSGAEPAPRNADGSLDWRNYVCPMDLKRHAGKTLAYVAENDKTYIRYFAAKAGVHQPYFQAAKQELGL
mgnify:CR=1 FL=1